MLLDALKHFLPTASWRMFDLFFIGSSPLDIFWWWLLSLDIPSDFDDFTIGEIVFVGDFS